MVPRLDSQFEIKDIVSEQFRDMAEAIVFLRRQLDEIAAGRPKDLRAFAAQASADVGYIFTPVQFIPLGKNLEP